MVGLNALLHTVFQPMLSLKQQPLDDTLLPLIRGFSEHPFLLETPSIVRQMIESERSTDPKATEYGALQACWALPKQALLDWQRLEMFLLGCCTRRALMLWRTGHKEYARIVALWMRHVEHGTEWTYLDKQMMSAYEYKRWFLTFARWFERRFPDMDLYGCHQHDTLQGVQMVIDPTLNVIAQDVWLHYLDESALEESDVPVFQDLQNRVWEYTPSRVRLSPWLIALQWVLMTYTFVCPGHTEFMVGLAALWMALSDFLTMNSYLSLKVWVLKESASETFRSEWVRQLQAAFRCHAISAAQAPIGLHRLANVVMGHYVHGWTRDALELCLSDGLTRGTRPVCPHWVFGAVGETLYEVCSYESFWGETLRNELALHLNRAVYCSKEQPQTLEWDARVWESNRRQGFRLFVACLPGDVDEDPHFLDPEFIQCPILVAEGVSLHDTLDGSSLQSVLEGKMVDGCAVMVGGYYCTMYSDTKMICMDGLGLVRTHRQRFRNTRLELMPFEWRTARYTVHWMNAFYQPGLYSLSIHEKTWLRRDYYSLADGTGRLFQLLQWWWNEDIHVNQWADRTMMLYDYMIHAATGRMGSNLIALTRNAMHWLHAFLIQYTYGHQWVQGHLILFWRTSLMNRDDPAFFSDRARQVGLVYPLRRRP